VQMTIVIRILVVLVIAVVLAYAAPSTGDVPRAIHSDPVPTAEEAEHQSSHEEDVTNHLEDFAECDMDHNGEIDVEELRICRASMDFKNIFVFFSEVDEDSSGTVSESEYLYWSME